MSFLKCCPDRFLSTSILCFLAGSETLEVFLISYKMLAVSKFSLPLFFKAFNCLKEEK